MHVPEDPLVGPPPSEIPLSNAPLVRVIAQVRFPLIASIEKREFIAPFQEAVRKSFPILRQEQTQLMFVGSGGPGPVEVRQANHWRFFDKASEWSLTLGSEFMTLETERYTSREDFFNRFESALAALETYIEPAVIDRLGVRYIDRIEEPVLTGLSQLVRPEVSGVLALPWSGKVQQALTENVFDLPEEGGRAFARWGLLPPQTTVDPAALRPVAGRSWVLDVDAFVESGAEVFEVKRTSEKARALAARIYSLFRWAVTDAFLRRYGAVQ